MGDVPSVRSTSLKSYVQRLEKDTEEALTSFRFDLIPRPFLDIWESLPEEKRHLPEHELKKELRAQAYRGDKQVFSLFNRMRLVFWELYEAAVISGDPIHGQKLCRNACPSQVYWRILKEYPLLTAWIICPLAGFMLQRKELEYLAEGRMIEILSQPAVDENGKVDSRLAKVQVELYQTLQDRIYGEVEQKINQNTKSVNVNVNANTSGEVADRTAALLTSVAEIDRRIKEIHGKRQALQSGGAQPMDLDIKKLVETGETINNR